MSQLTIQKNLYWDYLNKFGNTIFTLVTSVILSRILTPNDYGLVGISMAVNGVAGVFLNLGFSSAIVQEKKLDTKSLSSIFFLNIIIGLLLFSIVFLLSDPISKFYKIDKLNEVLKITPLSFITNSLTIVPSALLIKEMKFKEMSILTLASNFIGGIIGIVLALLNFGFWSIIFQQLITALFVAISFFYFSKWIPILYFRLSSIMSLIRFSMYLFFSGLLDTLFNRMDIFLIAKIFNTNTLGLYTRAQSLDVMVRNLSSASLLNVLFPYFAKVKDSGDDSLRLLFYKYFQLISFIFCLLAGAFYLSADQLFVILFGKQWNISASYYKILVLSGFAYPLSSLCLSIVQAKGNSKIFFISEIIKKSIAIPIYIIAFFYGIRAFLFSFVVYSTIATFVNIVSLRVELNFKIIDTVKFLLRYLVTSFLILAVLLFLANFFKLNSYIITPLIQVITFVGLYILLHVLLKSKGLDYSLELIRKND
jgi:O-antigen/teichoic acid export membrane protein